MKRKGWLLLLLIGGFQELTFCWLADDEVLIIKSLTHRNFNAMIKVSEQCEISEFNLYLWQQYNLAVPSIEKAQEN